MVQNVHEHVGPFKHFPYKMNWYHFLEIKKKRRGWLRIKASGYTDRKEPFIRVLQVNREMATKCANGSGSE